MREISAAAITEAVRDMCMEANYGLAPDMRKVFEKAVDYLNPETIASFIKLTHEEYRKRWGEDFGKLIPGIFFDEIYMMGNPLPWTDRLPGCFRDTYGLGVHENRPACTYNRGKAGRCCQ